MSTININALVEHCASEINIQFNGLNATATAATTVNGNTITINIAATEVVIDGVAVPFAAADYLEIVFTDGVITSSTGVDLFANNSGGLLTVADVEAQITADIFGNLSVDDAGIIHIDSEAGSYILVRFIDTPENDPSSTDQTELDLHNGVEVGTYTRNVIDGLMTFDASFENALGESGFSNISDTGGTVTYELNSNIDGTLNMHNLVDDNVSAIPVASTNAKLYKAINPDVGNNEFVYFGLIKDDSQTIEGSTTGKWFYIENNSSRIGDDVNNNGGETGSYIIDNTTNAMTLTAHFDDSTSADLDGSGLANEHDSSNPTNWSLVAQDHSIHLSPAGVDDALILTEVAMGDSEIAGIYGSGDATQTQYAVIFKTPDGTNTAPTASNTIADQTYTVGDTMLNPSDYFTDADAGDSLDYYVRYNVDGVIDPITNSILDGNYFDLNQPANPEDLGIRSVSIIAIDKSGAQAEQTFNVTINAAPIVTPLEEGSFIYVEYEEGSPADENGVEFGTYTYDASTERADFTAIFDDSNSDSTGSGVANTDSDAAGFTIKDNGDGTLYGSPNGGVDAADSANFTDVSARTTLYKSMGEHPTYLALIANETQDTAGVVKGNFVYLEYVASKVGLPSQSENGGETGTYELNTTTGKVTITGRLNDSVDDYIDVNGVYHPDDSGLFNANSVLYGSTALVQSHSLWLGSDVPGDNFSFILNEIDLGDSAIQGVYGSSTATSDNYLMIFKAPDATNTAPTVSNTITDQVYNWGDTIINPDDYFTDADAGDSLDYYLRYEIGGAIDPLSYSAMSMVHEHDYDFGTEQVTIIAVDKSGSTAEQTFNLTIIPPVNVTYEYLTEKGIIFGDDGQLHNVDYALFVNTATDETVFSHSFEVSQTVSFDVTQDAWIFTDTITGNTFSAASGVSKTFPEELENGANPTFDNPRTFTDSLGITWTQSVSGDTNKGWLVTNDSDDSFYYNESALIDGVYIDGAGHVTSSRGENYQRNGEVFTLIEGTTKTEAEWLTFAADFQGGSNDTTINDAPQKVGVLVDVTTEMADGNPLLDPTSFFSDPDGETLTYTVNSVRPNGSDSVTDTLAEWNSWYLDPVDAGQEGDWVVTVIAKDTAGKTAEQSFNWTVNIDTSLMNALIYTTNNLWLDNLTIHYINDGVDTGVSTLIEEGGIKIDNSVSFNAVTLSNDNIYSDNLNILDLYGVLGNIGQTIDTYAEHASDMDNDGVINISDLYDVLDGIGQAPQTFDLVDTNGNLVTSLDANSTSVANWTIIANGDVNASGMFEDIFTMASDMV